MPMCKCKICVYCGEHHHHDEIEQHIYTSRIHQEIEHILSTFNNEQEIQQSIYLISNDMLLNQIEQRKYRATYQTFRNSSRNHTLDGAVIAHGYRIMIRRQLNKYANVLGYITLSSHVGSLNTSQMFVYYKNELRQLYRIHKTYLSKYEKYRERRIVMDSAKIKYKINLERKTDFLYENWPNYVEIGVCKIISQYVIDDTELRFYDYRNM